MEDLAISCYESGKNHVKLINTLNSTDLRLDYWCAENIKRNLRKTTGEIFILNMQPFSPSLVYRGNILQYKEASTYLGFSFDC